ncbi:hypothetical protein GCM10010505_72330 [Kitasatospora aburaviensis]
MAAASAVEGYGLVAVLVAFTPVRGRSAPDRRVIPPQVRTPTTVPGQPDEHLESVLGATPHEFESRILRLCPTRQLKAPTGFPVGAFFVSWSQFWSQFVGTG